MQGMTPGPGSKKLQIAQKMFKRLIKAIESSIFQSSVSLWLNCCMEKYRGGRKNYATPYMM